MKRMCGVLLVILILCAQISINSVWAGKLAYFSASGNDYEVNKVSLRCLDLTNKQDKLICAINPQYFGGDQGFRWSADGKKLLFCSVFEAKGMYGDQILVVDTTAKKPSCRWLMRGKSPNMLRNGDVLHCWGTDGSDQLVGIDGIFLKYLNTVTAISSSPDGKRFVFAEASDKSTPAVININKAGAKPPGDYSVLYKLPKGLDVWSLNLSPDQKKVAFCADTGKGMKAYVLDIATKKVVELPFKPYGTVIWETASRLLYIDGRQSDKLYRYDLGTRRSIFLVQFKAADGLAIAYAP